MGPRTPLEATDGSHNPAQRLESLLELVLAQRLYAVEFAWAVTCLERHLQSAQGALGDYLAPESQPVVQRARGCLKRLLGVIEDVRDFVETANLGSLDRALAGARREIFPFDEVFAMARRVGGELLSLESKLRVSGDLDRAWQAQWQAVVHRHQGESRACFTCRQCGWEFAFVEEVGSAEEWELPFSELSCPICHP